VNLYPDNRGWWWWTWTQISPFTTFNALV